jgi:hypothetical protein
VCSAIPQTPSEALARLKQEHALLSRVLGLVDEELSSVHLEQNGLAVQLEVANRIRDLEPPLEETDSADVLAPIPGLGTEESPQPAAEQSSPDDALAILREANLSANQVLGETLDEVARGLD